MKREHIEEYKRRHAPAPAEVLAVIKRHGVTNYSIFLHEATGTLFGYFEAESDEELARIGDYKVSRDWWKSNAEILVCDPDNPDKGKEEELQEVFHLD